MHIGKELFLRKEEKMSKHAYLIMAFSEYEQLKMLIETLDYPGNDIYVHIDKRSPDVSADYLQGDVRYSNIKIFRDFKIFWGHYSQTACELFLLEQALNKEYDYIHLLSGADLPLCGQQEIHHFFDENKGKEFVRYWGASFPKNSEPWIKYYHPLQKYLRISKNKAFNQSIEKIEKILIKLQELLGVNRLKNTDCQFQKGANWFSITGEFAKYVVGRKPWIESVFMNTRSSDEVFLQTVLCNSEYDVNRFEKTYETDGLTGIRYIDWKRGKPYTFKIQDYQELISCGFLFARKFSISKDRRIVEKLHDHILKINQNDLAAIEITGE